MAPKLRQEAELGISAKSAPLFGTASSPTHAHGPPLRVHIGVTSASSDSYPMHSGAWREGIRSLIFPGPSHRTFALLSLASNSQVCTPGALCEYSLNLSFVHEAGLIGC